MPDNYLLAYDEGCGVCSRFKAVVAFLDARRLIEFVSLPRAEEVGALNEIDSRLRYRSFHLIAPDHGALSGSDALLPLLKLLLPGAAAVSRLLGVIPGRRAISFGYSAVSRIHDAGACATAAR